LIADIVSENPTMHERLVASHPLGRFAEPEEVTGAVVWLATSKSSSVTGVALTVDAGYLAAQSHQRESSLPTTNESEDRQ
jgi:NAD(P)-dependent dehydrogenase (short-subunit alcohol dehydrogenase family)